MKQKTVSKLVLLVLIISYPQLFFTPMITITNKFAQPSSAAVYDCIDAWIIICGDRPDHELSSEIWLTSQWVYHMVHACGTDYDDIYYLVADHMKDYTAFDDAIANDANIAYAFDTWAPTKVGPNGFLGVYMIDHGNIDVMGIAPFGSYTADELNADLDAFEAASGCDRMLVIYEACRSGSFLDEPSQSDRIIITSTAVWDGSDVSPLPPHRGLLADNLFPSLVAGKSVGDAFVDANNAIVSLGYGDAQFPCIEDNHDGVGHQVNAWGELPSTGDGYDANNLHICGECQTLEIHPPFYFKVPIKKWFVFDPVLVTIPVSVEIRNITNIDSAYVRVVPDDWQPPDPVDENATGGWDPAEDTYRWPLTWDATNGNYTGIIELFSPTNNTNYDLCFIVEDEDGYRGPVVKSELGLNDGVAPEDSIEPTVWIKNPNEGDTISEDLTIIAKGEDENSGLNNIQILIDGVVVNSTEMPNYLPYPDVTFDFNPSVYRNGAHNITALATDNAGNTNSFSVIIQVSGNPVNWIIWVIVGVGAVGFTTVVLIINSFRKRKLKK